MKNIALIGFGKIGKKFLNQSLKVKNITINKILRKRRTNIKLSNIKFFNNFNSLVKSGNIDGYIVATPVSSHYKFAKKIFRQKKPLIIEKPIVSNINELKKITTMYKNYKQSIFVNHSDLYNPAFLALLGNLKSIGMYNKINISFGKQQKIKKFNVFGKKKYFLPSFDWLPHPFAIAIKLAGVPQNISIIKNNIFIKKKYIFQRSHIRFICKRKVVNINFSNQYSIPKKRIEIIGSKATLIYDAYKKNMLLSKSKDGKTKKIFYKKIDSFENLLKLFYFSMKNKYTRKDINFAYKVMQILFKVENEMKNKLKSNRLDLKS